MSSCKKFCSGGEGRLYLNWGFRGGGQGHSSRCCQHNFASPIPACVGHLWGAVSSGGSHRASDCAWEKKITPPGSFWLCGKIWIQCLHPSLILRAAPAPSAALAPKRVPGQAAPAAAAPLLQTPALEAADGIWEGNLTKKDLLPAKIFPWGTNLTVLAESLPQSSSFQLKTNRKAKFFRGWKVLVGDAASMPTLAPSGPSSPPGHLALCWQHLPWACRGDTAWAALGSTQRNWLCKVRPFGPFPVDTRSTPSTAT